MAAPVYHPLTLDKIEEGQFLQKANEDLQELQRTMLAYLGEHGEQALKAKGKLTLEISIVIENAKECMFSIKTTPKMSLPARPPGTSMAIATITQDGEESLFVRETGSDKTTPRQGKFCTDEGRIPAAEPVRQEPARE